MTANASGRRIVVWAVLLLIYVVVLAVGVAGLVRARQWALKSLATEASQEDWRVWQDVTRRHEAGEGPVYRRAAKASEPPGLILLRDHFGVCLTAWLLLGSGVILPSGWMLAGAMSRGNDKQSASGESDSMVG